MNNISVSLTCGFCNKETISSDETEDLNMFLSIDFKEGNIKYICPSCMQVNQMFILSNDSLNKTNRLPKIKGF